jgi:Ca2+-binding RTX toxin-like protein
MLPTGIFLDTQGVIQIDGTALGDTALVSTASGRVVVQLKNALIVSPSRGSSGSSMTIYEGPVVQVNLKRSFLASEVKGIRFRGYDGNDVFTNFTRIPSVAFGGRGGDVLRGGSAVDELFGGEGEDQGNRTLIPSKTCEKLQQDCFIPARGESFHAQAA